MATGRALIDVAVVQLTMRTHDKVEMIDIYFALKLSSVYEELSPIMVVDIMVESHLLVPEDMLDKVLPGHELEGDIESYYMES